MLFFAVENVGEQFARDEIASRLAVNNGRLEVGMGFHLELQVALQAFLDIFADQEFAEFLQIGNAFQEQDALDQLVGVLHLVDRLVVLVVAELLQPPVLEHPGVKKILVDRREFVQQHLVQMLDDLLVAFHCVLLCETSTLLARILSGAACQELRKFLWAVRRMRSETGMGFSTCRAALANAIASKAKQCNPAVRRYDSTTVLQAAEN